MNMPKKEPPFDKYGIKPRPFEPIKDEEMLEYYRKLLYKIRNEKRKK